jgi:diketogulonate reductase-like aldo/keto reductase
MPQDTSRIRTVEGVAVPSFFYGTAWKEERTRELTSLAIAAGFRAIDTANQRRHYLEAAVGEALSLPRDQIFLQTKFTYARGQDHRLPYDPQAAVAMQVEQSMESSLEHLGTPHVDALLLHGPWANRGIAREDREAWQAMEALRRTGKVHLLGISNVSVEQLTSLLETGARPSIVQNRCYARTGWDRDVRVLCRARGVAYQGFSLLTANRRELESAEMTALAARLGRTPAQIIFAFALQTGMFPLTGTSSATHMREDLACFDFQLSPTQMGTVERIGEAA